MDGNYGSIPGIGEVQGWDRWVVLPKAIGIQPLRWPGSELAAGSVSDGSISALSLYRALIDDKNASGRVDFGDEFVILEYDLQITNWTTNVIGRIPTTTTNPASAFGITVANFTLAGPNCLFSAEPGGELFAWSSQGGTIPARQIFSADYLGKA